jgi:predicted PurR-regulated permease PerM
MESSHSARSGGIASPLVTMAALVVVIAGLRVAQPILAPCLLAAFLAIICFPPLTWLRERRLPDWLALLIVIGAGVGIVLFLVAILGNSLSEFSSKLPAYQARLFEQMEQAAGWLESKGIEVGEITRQEGFDSRKVLNLVSRLVGTVGSLSSDVFVILLIFVFLLVEGITFPSKLKAMPEYTPERAEQLRQILGNVRQYLAIKTQLSLATAVLVTVLLVVLGVDFPVLWGLLAFLLNYVPNIGSFIAAIPAVVLALIQLGFGPAFSAAAGYAVINIVIGNVIEPRVMGKGLGLSTLVVFLSLLFWGWVLGSVGMLLSVPLTMILKIVLQSVEETRWLAILMGSGAPTENAQAVVSTADEN